MRPHFLVPRTWRPKFSWKAVNGDGYCLIVLNRLNRTLFIWLLKLTSTWFHLIWIDLSQDVSCCIVAGFVCLMWTLKKWEYVCIFHIYIYYYILHIYTFIYIHIYAYTDDTDVTICILSIYIHNWYNYSVVTTVSVHSL